MIKPTIEQIESSLKRSERSLQPLAGEQKRLFLEKLLVTPKPWYRRFWQLWLAVPLAGAAVAGVIWYLNVQAPVETQLANEHSDEPIANTNVRPRPNELANSNAHLPGVIETPDGTDSEPNTELAPRSNQLNQSFYFGLGGGAEYDYSAIQFIDSTSPAPTATAQVKQRTLLSQFELQRLAGFFAVDAADTYFNLSAEQVTETDCSQHFLQPAATSCLTMSAAGMIHYIAADSQNLNLTQTTELIANLTGLTAGQYHTESLGTIEGTNYQHYHIYNPTSLTTGLSYRDLGWDVYMLNGRLHSLRGYVLPAMEPADTVTLISPTEALARLRAGFKPLNRTTNPNTARLGFSYFYLDSLMGANEHPTLALSDFTLEYSLAVTSNQLSLIPVYYLRGMDASTGKALDLYIDPTTSGNLFATYNLISL